MVSFVFFFFFGQKSIGIICVSLFLHFLLCFINLFDYLSTTTMLSWLLYFVISIEIKYGSPTTLFFLRLLFLHNIPFMNAQLLSHVQFFATSWTVACQALLSMEFPRQESWSGLPFPFPRDLLNLGIKLTSPTLQADSLLLSHQGSLLLHFIAVYFIAIAPWYKSD